MNFWSLIRRMLFLLDAERAHKWTVVFIRLGARLGGGPLRVISGAQTSQSHAAPRVFGMEFQSRLGLAAGFDKNAEILHALPDLGFGFAEIGTVTPLPQSGNPRPRLFRDLTKASIFNRMGFNNLGAVEVARRVERVRPRLPAHFRVGVNIGKNKDTPLEDAAADYVRAVRPFHGLADYIVINVSSPNTPGLRSLQTVEQLAPIVEKVRREVVFPTPLLLKLSPELTADELAAVLRAGEGWGISGWVLTNTLAGEWHSTRARAAGAGVQTGGWSGAILTERSRQRLQDARSLTQLPIISVGGIMSPEEASLRIALGADLVQIYTGWIMNGPSFCKEITENLRR